MRRNLNLSIVGLAAVTAAASLVALTSTPAQAAPRFCDGHRATIVGTAGKDVVRGTNRRDVIVTFAGNDTIRGRGGHDVVCAGAGADDVYGGPRRDRLHGGRDQHGYDRGGSFQVGDRLRGGPGADRLDPGFDDPSGTDQIFQPDLVDYRDSARAVEVDMTSRVVTGEGRDTFVASTNIGVIGSGHADTVRGTTGPDYIVGAAGDDLLRGNDGPDRIFAEDPEVVRSPHDSDRIDGGAGADQIDSGRGRDTLLGGDGRDQISAFSHRAAEVRAGAGDDSVVQLVGKDTGMVIDPGAGRNDLTLYTRLSDDVAARLWLRADATAGTLQLADGPAGAFGAWHDVTFMTGTKVSYKGSHLGETVTTLIAGPLRAWTYGGDDDIFGSQKNDHVDAGDGADRVRAGGGQDTCLNAEREFGCEQ